MVDAPDLGSGAFGVRVRVSSPAPPSFFISVILTIKLIGNKWKLLILRALFLGTCRFNQLQKELGDISQKVLTENLRDLERAKLISRTVYPEVPPRVEYSLTPLGQSLRGIVQAMKDFGENYQATFLQRKK